MVDGSCKARVTVERTSGKHYPVTGLTRGKHGKTTFFFIFLLPPSNFTWTSNMTLKQCFSIRRSLRIPLFHRTPDLGSIS